MEYAEFANCFENAVAFQDLSESKPKEQAEQLKQLAKCIYELHSQREISEPEISDVDYSNMIKLILLLYIEKSIGYRFQTKMDTLAGKFASSFDSYIARMF
jgi:hypothetical protein